MGSSVPMYLRTDTVDDAKSDLIDLLGWYITDEDGEPDAATIEARVTDQAAEEWWRLAGHRSEQRDMLLRLGVDSYELDGLPEVWETLYSPRTQLNPDYAQTEEGRRHLDGTLEGLHLRSGAQKEQLESKPKVRVPSIPMSIKECAGYLARTAEKQHPGRKSQYTPRFVRRLMNRGLMPFEQHGRELFTFCCKAHLGLPSRQGE